MYDPCKHCGDYDGECCAECEYNYSMISEEAFIKACEFITEYNGSCPSEIFEFDNECETKCNKKKVVDCWKKYFHSLLKEES